MDESQAGFGGFGLRFCGRWGRRGFRGARGVADAEGAADGVQQALQGGGQSEEFGDSGFGEEGFEVHPGEGSFVFEFAEQPGGAGGQGRTQGVRARRIRALAVAARVDARAFAGGDAGHGGADDAGGAVEAVAEQRGEGGEAGVAAEAQRDEADELGDERGKAGREDWGQEAWIGRGGCRGHVSFDIT